MFEKFRKAHTLVIIPITSIKSKTLNILKSNKIEIIYLNSKVIFENNRNFNQIILTIHKG